MQKMYVKTIKISMSCAIVCIIISIILATISNSQKGIILFQNYCIGLACSFLVVIVTTYFQYTSEHNKAYKEYMAALLHLLFNLSLTVDDELSENQYNTLYDMLDTAFERFKRASIEMKFFTKKEDDLQFVRDKALYSLFTDFERIPNDRIAAVKQVADKNRIIETIDNYTGFMPDGFEKDHLNIIKKTLLCTENGKP